MTEDFSSSQDPQPARPNPGLKALDVMVGTWDLTGRDFTTNEEIRGQSAFEWMEGGFFLIHRFSFEYAGRPINGVEYIGYDEKSGHLKTHVYSNHGPEPSEYTWEVDGTSFINWFGDVGSDNHYKGKFNADHTSLVGQWEWPGGGYEAVMTKIK